MNEMKDEYHVVISDESMEFLINLMNELNEGLLPLSNDEKKIVSSLHRMFTRVRY